MRTFYLAAAGDRWAEVRELGRQLEALGYQWAFDWTKGVELLGRGAEGSSLEVKRANAEGDIRACMECDLFVLLLDQPAGRGAFMEVGARIASGKIAHVVGEEDHLFWSHPSVRRHASWGEFLSRHVGHAW